MEQQGEDLRCEEVQPTNAKLEAPHFNVYFRAPLRNTWCKAQKHSSAFYHAVEMHLYDKEDIKKNEIKLVV